MRPLAASCLLCAVLVVTGCEKSEPQLVDPIAAADAVAATARATFDGRSRGIRIEAEGGGGHAWRASGLVQLSRGRFRVEATRAGASRRDGDAPRRTTVIGTDGEGSESTFRVFRLNPTIQEAARRRPCWFNPHSPVGFPGEPLSVEESMRVIGAVLESLRSEIAAARAGGGNRYQVELSRSAGRPRDRYRRTQRREWGERGLLTRIEGPVLVQVRHGLVTELSLRLRFERQPAARDRVGPGKVRIEASSWATTEGKLVLNPPPCQAIE